MNTNITRCQLPNGNLLKIEGADAEQVARIITELNEPVINTTDETPLELPALNFAKEPVPSDVADDEEAVLEMPTTV